MSPRPSGGSGGRGRPSGGGGGGRSGGPDRGGSAGRGGSPGAGGGRGGASGGGSGGGRPLGGPGGRPPGGFRGGRPGGGGKRFEGDGGGFGGGPGGSRLGNDRGYGGGEGAGGGQGGSGRGGSNRGASGRSPGRGDRGREDRERPREIRGAFGDGARGPSVPTDQLVYGRNPVRELLRANRRGVQMIHASEQVSGTAWLAAAPLRVASNDELAELAGTTDHQGIVATCAPYPYVDISKLVGKKGVVVVLDEITDPRNVGAIARTAEATGAIGLVLPERRSAQVTATVCKTSAGAIEHLRVAQVRNLSDALAELKAGGAWTYGAAMEGTPVGELDLSGPTVLILGGEGKGLRPRVASNCDALVSLPMVGHVDSLNVSAAAAVLLYAAMAARTAK